MDSQLSVYRFGSAYFPAAAGIEQPDLKNLLAEECKTRSRRLDRFTQLSLLGAARCVGAFSLEAKTALYLASGTGPAENNINMQRQIFRDEEAPSPIQFINSVTNSASFYVMKDHRLHGQNIFVSRHKHAFEAALELASVDLNAGRVSSALVGIVDEITHPLEQQRIRLGLSEHTPLGEGSHWFLVSSSKIENFTDGVPAISAGAALGMIEQVNLYRNETNLYEWLTTQNDSALVYFDSNVDATVRHRCLEAMSNARGNAREYSDDRENHWDGRTAGVVGRFLHKSLTRSDSFTVLLSIGSANEGRYQVIKARKP